jgi:hypothetical protein
MSVGVIYALTSRAVAVSCLSQVTDSVDRDQLANLLQLARADAGNILDIFY